MAQLKVSVVNRKELQWQGEAAYVSVPSVEGALGILPGRSPVVAALTKGTVHITTTEGKEIEFPFENGFAAVDQDYVNIIHDKA